MTSADGDRRSPRAANAGTGSTRCSRDSLAALFLRDSNASSDLAATPRSRRYLKASPCRVVHTFAKRRLWCRSHLVARKRGKEAKKDRTGRRAGQGTLHDSTCGGRLRDQERISRALSPADLRNTLHHHSRSWAPRSKNFKRTKAFSERMTLCQLQNLVFMILAKMLSWGACKWYSERPFEKRCTTPRTLSAALKKEALSKVPLLSPLFHGAADTEAKAYFFAAVDELLLDVTNHSSDLMTYMKTRVR